MNESPLLDRIRIATPCDASWNDMTGGERMRRCGLCKLNVYNLSAMRRDEAESLIRTREGRLCVRLYQRSDGTVITRDCPKGLARIRRRFAIAVTAVVTLVAAALTGALFASERPQQTCNARDLPVVGNLIRLIDPDPVFTMGEAVIGPPPPTSGSTTSPSR